MNVTVRFARDRISSTHPGALAHGKATPEPAGSRHLQPVALVAGLPPWFGSHTPGTGPGVGGTYLHAELQSPSEVALVPLLGRHMGRPVT